MSSFMDWIHSPEIKREAWVYSHTGGVVHDPYWQALDAHFHADPAGFAERHPLEVGFLVPPSQIGMLPHNRILDDLRHRHDIDPARFTHWHHFWGGLLAREPHLLSQPPPQLGPPASVPGQVVPPVVAHVGSQAVPEPASIVTLALAIIVVAAGLWLPRKAGYR